MSDNETSVQSGLLQLLVQGDMLVADRGFDIDDELCAIGCTLNVPPKRNKDGALTAAQVEKTRHVLLNSGFMLNDALVEQEIMPY